MATRKTAAEKAAAKAAKQAAKDAAANKVVSDDAAASRGSVEAAPSDGDVSAVGAAASVPVCSECGAVIESDGSAEYVEHVEGCAAQDANLIRIERGPWHIDPAAILHTTPHEDGGLTVATSKGGFVLNAEEADHFRKELKKRQKGAESGKSN